MIVYFAIIAAFALFFAHYCAWDDNIQTSKNEAIHHIKQWLIRAGVAVAAITIISGVGEVLTLRMFGLMSVAVAFLFSAWFRYRLNKLRGLDWWYISISNYYDRFFISVVRLFVKRPKSVYSGKVGSEYVDEVIDWQDKTRLQACVLAYTTELTLTLAAFTVAAILGS